MTYAAEDGTYKKYNSEEIKVKVITCSKLWIKTTEQCAECCTEWV